MCHAAKPCKCPRKNGTSKFFLRENDGHLAQFCTMIPPPKKKHGGGLQSCIALQNVWFLMP